MVLISGSTCLEPPKGVELVRVKTTEDMLNAVGKYFATCDVLIKSAAPVDYRPESVSSSKIKKNKDTDELTIKYVKILI